MNNPFKEWSRDFRLLAAAVFAVGAFFGVQLGLYNNFVVSRLAIEPQELGYVEALREVPGFLQAIFIALMVRLAPSVISGFALGIMGIGIAIPGIPPIIGMLIIGIMPFIIIGFMPIMPIPPMP